MYTKSIEQENERLRSLLNRASLALREGPLVEPELHQEIDVELERGPVSSIWYLGVHAAIERLKETAQVNTEYLDHLDTTQEVDEVERHATFKHVEAMQSAIDVLNDYLSER